jgi:hypothetical protein
MEYLYTAENIKMILGPSENPGKKISDCPICQNLPDSVSKVDAPARNEFSTLPDEVSKLEEFILIKSTWHILKCPLCCRLYADEYRYEHLVGGSEDKYVISRIDYHDALEMMKGIKAKKLVKDGSRWLVSW